MTYRLMAYRIHRECHKNIATRSIHSSGESRGEKRLNPGTAIHCLTKRIPTSEQAGGKLTERKDPYLARDRRTLWSSRTQTIQTRR